MSINLRWASALVIASSVGVLGSVAHAQGNIVKDVVPVVRPFSVKLGVFFPHDSRVQDSIGKNFLSIGLSYDFAKSRLLAPSIYSLYVDYIDKRRTNTYTNSGGGSFDAREELTYVNVGLGARFLLVSANEANHPYVLTGIGATFLRDKFKSGNGTDKTNKTKISGKLGAGYELQNGLLGEVEYDFVDRTNGVNPSGTQLRFGYRF